MRFQVTTGKPEKQRCKVAVVPVFASGKLGSVGKAIDALAAKSISAVIKAGDISGKAGEILLKRLPLVRTNLQIDEIVEFCSPPASRSDIAD